MKNIISIILCILSSNILFAQENAIKDSSNVALIQSFVNDLSNPDVKSDIIISQYLTIGNPSDELYDYLEVSLDEIRINLSTKELDKIQYIPYLKMPKKEVADIDLEENLPAKIYFIKHLDRLVISILLEENKIASFTLVSKGNKKAHFVRY